MTIQVPLTVEMNEVERELTFEFEYRAFEKGSCDQYGQQIEPDLEESLDLFAVYDENGDEFEGAVPEDIEIAKNLAFQEIHN